MNMIVTPTAESEQNTASVLPPANIIQQRHILALMGIEVWAQREVPTVSVDYEVVYQNLDDESPLLYEAQSENISDTPIVSDIPTRQHQSVQPNVQSPVDTVINTNHSLTQHHAPDSSAHSAEQPSALAQIDTNKISKPTSLGPDSIGTLKRNVDRQDITTENTASAFHHEMSLEHVEPFEVMGVRYKQWVILADVSELRESQSVQLWENILLGLSVTAQSQRFPICEGITDKESANASVAGFIFKLAQSDCQKIIALTPLPECLELNAIVQGPYLSDMIENSHHKKALWQKINA